MLGSKLNRRRALLLATGSALALPARRLAAALAAEEEKPAAETKPPAEAKPAADGKPPAAEAQGIDLGGKAMLVYVARDKAQWTAVKEAVGARQMMPRGTTPGDPLERLDDTDFEQQMIVGVFWGEMNFSGHNEKCWIQEVRVEDKQVIVHCRADLWGGNVFRSYRAWPYDVKAVPQSALPVLFEQTTIYQAAPQNSVKDQPLATLKPGEWKQEVKRPE